MILGITAIGVGSALFGAVVGYAVGVRHMRRHMARGIYQMMERGHIVVTSEGRRAMSLRQPVIH